MNVLVGIPWRAQEHRRYAYEMVRARYADLLPHSEILAVDTDHDEFCLAACRNEIVRVARRAGAEVVVISDADTMAEPDPLYAAIQAAADDIRVHLPYDQYRSLREDGTRQYLAGTPLERCNHLVVDGACSGVYVTTPKTWWSHGGQDERFLGWGGEDAAWFAAHKTLLGAEPARHTGTVFALHHESQAKEGDQYTANFALVYRYLQAERDPDTMRALITEAEHATSPTA